MLACHRWQRPAHGDSVHSSFIAASACSTITSANCGFRANGARVIERFVRASRRGFCMKISPLPPSFAGAGRRLAFDAQQHRNVLIAVQTVADEKRHDDHVGRVGQLRPIGDERRLLHVGVEHGGVLAPFADERSTCCLAAAALLSLRLVPCPTMSRLVSASGTPGRDLPRAAQRAGRSWMRWLPTGAQ